MALDAVRRFFAAVGENQSLQVELNKALASEPDRFEAVARFAREHGHDVTAAEVRAAAEADAAEMSDEDLAKVAGGVTQLEGIAQLGGLTHPGRLLGLKSGLR